MSVITVDKKLYTVEPLYQWDLNQELEIRGLSLARAPEIHFTSAAMSRAIVRNASMDVAGVVRVNIPNSLLQSPYQLNVYVCTRTGATFETLYKIEVPVVGRPQPEGYQLTNDDEVYSFEALENEVKNATYTAAQLSAKITEEVESIKNVGRPNSVLTSGNDGRLTNAGTPTADPSVLLGRPEAAPAWATLSTVAAAMGCAIVETGTYVGTGTYGEANPNTLTFSRKPVVVIITSYQPGSANSGGFALFMRGNPVGAAGWSVADRADIGGAAPSLDWSQGTKVSWHTKDTSTNGALYQLNNSGVGYYYAALTLAE